MASIRLQLLPALISAKAKGHNAPVLSLHSNHPEDFELINKTDVCLIGKMSANSPVLAESMIMANSAAIFGMKANGCKIIIQYSDHILEQGDRLARFYTNIFKFADLIIYPSKALQNLALPFHTNKCKAMIIEDPWQINNEHPFQALAEKDFCRLIWFGSNKNIHYLLPILHKMFHEADPKFQYELTILGQPFAHKLFNRFQEKIPKIYPNWQVRLVPWNNAGQPSQLEQELSRAHISLIPSNPQDPLKAGVGHNRVVDSIRGGCIPLASPMESYLELKDICITGANFTKMLNYCTKNYSKLTKQIEAKRSLILERFSPDANFAAWSKLWDSI